MLNMKHTKKCQYNGWIWEYDKNDEMCSDPVMMSDKQLEQNCSKTDKKQFFSFFLVFATLDARIKVKKKMKRFNLSQKFLYLLVFTLLFWS